MYTVQSLSTSGFWSCYAPVRCAHPSFCGQYHTRALAPLPALCSFADRLWIGEKNSFWENSLKWIISLFTLFKLKQSFLSNLSLPLSSCSQWSVWLLRKPIKQRPARTDRQIGTVDKPSLMFIREGYSLQLSSVQSFFGLHVAWCAQLYSLAETPQPPPPIPRIGAHLRGRYWSVKIDDIIFITLWFWFYVCWMRMWVSVS